MTDALLKSRPVSRPSNGTGPVLLTLGGLVAAFGVASCCALPLFLVTVGLGTAWIGGIALLAEPLRPYLIGAAIVGLAGGAGLVWRQSHAKACAPGSICARPAVRVFTAIGIVLGAVLLYYGYTVA